MRHLMLLILSGMTANAMPVQFQSPVRQTALVELYSSEGCSSCPPAEAALSRLKDSSGLWSDFVPMAFHVDYWDSLGWRDPWAKKEFTARQRNYAHIWGSDTVYTPGFVLNGEEWIGWPARQAVPPVSEVKAGVLRVSSADGVHWQAGFTPSTNGVAAYQIHVALLASGLASDVKHGENAGHQLHHDFLVATLTQKTLLKNGAEFECSFILDTSQPAAEGRPVLAMWVTRDGQLKPVQATGGWLAEKAR